MLWFKIFCNLNIIAFFLYNLNLTSMKFISNAVLACYICTLAFYLQSCYDPNSNVECNDTETITQNISAGDLSKVPCTGFDILYSLDKKGDTRSFPLTSVHWAIQVVLVVFVGINQTTN